MGILFDTIDIDQLTHRLLDSDVEDALRDSLLSEAYEGLERELPWTWPDSDAEILSEDDDAARVARRQHLAEIAGQMEVRGAMRSVVLFVRSHAVLSVRSHAEPCGQCIRWFCLCGVMRSHAVGGRGVRSRRFCLCGAIQSVHQMRDS